MTTKDEALKRALGLLESMYEMMPDPPVSNAIKMCREALAQKDKQESALWKWILRSDPGHFGYYTEHPSKFGIDMSSEKYEWTLFYTAPPKRKPLTNEEIGTLWNRFCDEMGYVSPNDADDMIHEIEAHHGIGGEA